MVIAAHMFFLLAAPCGTVLILKETVSKYRYTPLKTLSVLQLLALLLRFISGIMLIVVVISIMRLRLREWTMTMVSLVAGKIIIEGDPVLPEREAGKIIIEGDPVLPEREEDDGEMFKEYSVRRDWALELSSQDYATITGIVRRARRKDPKNINEAYSKIGSEVNRALFEAKTKDRSTFDKSTDLIRGLLLDIREVKRHMGLGDLEVEDVSTVLSSFHINLIKPKMSQGAVVLTDPITKEELGVGCLKILEDLRLYFESKLPQGCAQ